MGKLRKFQILIDNPKGVFYPGEVVTAQVVLEVKEEMKLREIKAKFTGFADVHWTEQRRTKNGTYTVHYRNHETYFDQKVIVLGKERGKKDNIVLQPGSYTYAVSFTLPAGIPSSYEAQIGKVRYQIKVTIDRPWAFDDHTKTLFTVASLFDLNKEPALMNEATATDQKVLCCCCCASDPIIATVKLPRTGYVPGEVINFNAEIDNRSDRTMNCTKAKLVMQVKYHASSKTRTVNNVLYQKKQGKIDGGGTDVWRDEKILIPPVPPSYLLGCKIIDIRYLAMIAVDPKGPGFDLEVPVEVVIGSIPFASVAQQYGVNVQPIAPPTGAPKGLYSDQSVPHMPPPSYAESAFGRVDTREEGEDEHTAGNTNYAPVYSYYNWNKQDPSKHFAVQMDEN